MLFLPCTFTLEVDEENFGGGGVNFGGGGGGGISLNGDVGLPPLNVGEINFFGAGIFDTFLTSKPADDGSIGFENSETCS